MMKLDTVSPQRALNPVAPDGRIGLIALATDINIEQDLRRIYPSTVEVFTSPGTQLQPTDD